MCTNLLAPARTFDDSITEMMDRPQPALVELRANLENLRRLNRYFGSYALVSCFLRRWFRPGNSVTVIDFCTGLGDIPRFIVDWCRASDVRVEITAVDAQPATLDLAIEKSASY